MRVIEPGAPCAALARLRRAGNGATNAQAVNALGLDGHAGNPAQASPAALKASSTSTPVRPAPSTASVTSTMTLAAAPGSSFSRFQSLHGVVLAFSLLVSCGLRLPASWC